MSENLGICQQLADYFRLDVAVLQDQHRTSTSPILKKIYEQQASRAVMMAYKAQMAVGRSAGK